MKKWVEKLIEQFDFDWSAQGGNRQRGTPPTLDEDRATILFMLDTFNKHLIEIEGHPVRKTRETLDEFAKELISPSDPDNEERLLFRLRQFFSSYRIDETSYFQKTFEEFRTIIWDFIDQLAEDIGQEQREDNEVKQSLDELKEAVESNSIEVLKSQSRKFIDCYVEKQFKKDKRRSMRMKSIQKNLKAVKRQLNDAVDAAQTDHLTGAYNRKAFDEQIHQSYRLAPASNQDLCLILVDIDHFKKINDSYGHPIGDFVLKELVRILKSHFSAEGELVARVGGEEFAILLNGCDARIALRKSEDFLNKVRAEIFVQENHQIRFTVSVGISELGQGEDLASWTKRADLALYHSKNTGRNRATVAPMPVEEAA